MRFAILTALTVLLFLSCGDTLRNDELDCEEAVSHLEHCCPGFDSSGVSCVWQSHGCDGSTVEIDSAQSQCIRNRSCAELVASGVCDRESQAAADPYARSAEVCP